MLIALILLVWYVNLPFLCLYVCSLFLPQAHTNPKGLNVSHLGRAYTNNKLVYRAFSKKNSHCENCSQNISRLLTEFRQLTGTAPSGTEKEIKNANLKNLVKYEETRAGELLKAFTGILLHIAGKL